jgi:hypothetical protein
MAWILETDLGVWYSNDITMREKDEDGAKANRGRKQLFP